MAALDGEMDRNDTLIKTMRTYVGEVWAWDDALAGMVSESGKVRRPPHAIILSEDELEKLVEKLMPFILELRIGSGDTYFQKTAPHTIHFCSIILNDIDIFNARVRDAKAGIASYLVNRKEFLGLYIGRDELPTPQLTAREIAAIEAFRRGVELQRDPLLGRGTGPTQPFPYYTHNEEPHTGFDISARKSTPIYSMYGGTVVNIRELNNGKGYSITIKTDNNPTTGGEVWLQYIHMGAHSRLRPGDVVVPGTQIGNVGQKHVHLSNLQVPNREPTTTARQNWANGRMMHKSLWILSIRFPARWRVKRSFLTVC